MSLVLTLNSNTFQMSNQSSKHWFCNVQANTGFAMCENTTLFPSDRCECATNAQGNRHSLCRCDNLCNCARILVYGMFVFCMFVARSQRSLGESVVFSHITSWPARTSLPSSVFPSVLPCFPIGNVKKHNFVFKPTQYLQFIVLGSIG